MSYTAVEAWKPKSRFIEASPDERAHLFEGVRAAVAGLALAGGITQGWGRVDADLDHASGHTWFAVWEFPTPEVMASFFEGVSASGWYDYFDQINLAGRLDPVNDALDALLVTGGEK